MSIKTVSKVISIVLLTLILGVGAISLVSGVKNYFDIEKSEEVASQLSEQEEV